MISRSYKPGSPGAQRLVRVVILALAAGLFFFLYQQHQFRGLTHPVAMEYAQLGRALAEGDGYQTRMLRPIDLAVIERRQAGTDVPAAFPELRRPPLYPAALALGFRLIRPDFEVQPTARPYQPESRVIIPVNLVFTLATAIILFLIAHRFFDPRVAGLAPVVFVLSHTVLQRSLAGMPDAMATLLGTASLAIALWGIPARDDDPRGSVSFRRILLTAVGAGLLMGGAVLGSHHQWLFACAPLLVFALAYQGRRRTVALAVYSMIIVAVLTPWILHNLRVSGYPFGLAHWEWLRGTAAFPENQLDRSITWNPEALRIGQLLRLRWLDGLAAHNPVARWCAAGETLLPILALFALLTPTRHRGLRILRWPILGAASLMLLVDPILSAEIPGVYLYALLPWIMLLGCAGWIGLLDRSGITWPIIRQSIGALILLVHLTPVAAVLLKPRPPLPYPPIYPPFVAAACAMVESDSLMVSDMPWATAWYGRQRTLWLPNTLRDFYAINDHRQTVAGLYLTTETSARPYVGDLLDGRHRDWLPILQGSLPDGFPLTDGLRLPPGRQDQLLLIGAGQFVEGLSAE